jgi:AcrR family transcriptional regulator
MYLIKTQPKSARRGTAKAARRRPRRTLSRQQARTAATKEKLLGAAERIFARDGFEAARLEDIAAAAGYTRGAFYANYDDKEDLFFALLEQWVSQRMAEVNALLQERKRSLGEQLRTLRNYYAERAKDRRLTLLSLEFTLYAVRHPAAHVRLRIRRKRLRSCGADLLRRITGAMGCSLPVSAEAATVALGAFSNALFLEHIVEAKALRERSVQRLLGVFFDAIARGRAAK